MAYIQSATKTNTNSASTATFTIPITATHESGDLLIACVGNRTSVTTIATSTTGWAILGTQAGFDNQRAVVIWKIATSSSEADLVVTGANNAWQSTLLVVKNFDATTPFETHVKTDTAAIPNCVSGSVTTTSDNCLILQFGNTDGTSVYTIDRSELNYVTDDVTSIISFVGYRNQYTAGATPTFQVKATGSRRPQIWTIAIKDVDPANAKLSPDFTDCGQTILRSGLFQTSYDDQTWASNDPDDLAATTIETYGLSTSIPSLSTTQTPTNSAWGNSTTINSSENMGGVTKWVGGVNTFSTPIDMSNNFIGFEFVVSSMSNVVFPNGYIFVIEDSVGAWKAYRILDRAAPVTVNLAYQVIIDVENYTPVDSSGTLDFSDITKIAFLHLREGSNTTASGMRFKTLFGVEKIKLVSGCVESPIKPSFVKNLMDGWTKGMTTGLQGVGQTFFRLPFQIGDGSIESASNTFGESNEISRLSNPAEEEKRYWYVDDSAINNEIYASAGDNVDFNASIIAANSRQNFTINASSSSSATYNFAGTSFIGYDIVNNVTGINFNGATFSGCYQMTLNGGGLDGCLVTNYLVSTAVITDDPGNITDTTFTSPGTGHAIEMTATGTFDFEGNTFTGYGADGTTDAAIYNNSGGLITLDLAPGDTAPTVLNGTGASTTINAFVASVGIDFTTLIAGSQVVIYTAGTTTELFRTNTSGTSESYDQVTTSLDVDYTIMKAGYVPIRVTALHLTSVQAIPVQQVEDRAYVASSGLTFGTTATVNTGTKIFEITVASTVQNWYSFMIESWIAETSLRNVQFPIEPNGPNSYTLTSGWEWVDQDSIDLLSRDGMRYRNAGVVTAVWSALLSLGTATGFQGRYQQALGAAPNDAPATGVFDQLIQVYGDATHGNFDFTGYLTLKFQPNGYYQSIADVDSIYGTLADEFYIVSMEPQAIPGFTTGDPSITGVTITNHGATPVSWDAGNGAKDYSITVTDSATNSAEDIMRWINYNLSLGGTFQSDEAFNYPDMIITDGTDFETERGTFVGSAGATLKGIRVIRTGDIAHPGFTRFQADDGTYGEAPQTQSVTITNGVAGTRVQIYDLTSTTELYNDIPASYPFTWNDTVAYVADREIRVRAMYQDGTDAKLFVDTVIGTSTATELALSLRLNQEDDTVYIANAIDGSAVTDITIDDGALLLEIDTGAVSWPQLYAYETYWLFTEEGIRDEGRFIEAKDTANYILYDFKIKNITSPEVPLTITNGWGYDSVTNTTIELFDTSGGAIFAAPDRVIAFATGSGLSPTEQAQLLAIATDTPLIKNNTDLIPATL